MSSRDSTVSVILSADLRAAIDAVAQREARTLSWVVREAIRSYVGRRRPRLSRPATPPAEPTQQSGEECVA